MRAILVLLPVAAIAFAGSAFAQLATPTARPTGDATLPAGMANVVWGAAPDAVEAVRARPMEVGADRQIDFEWRYEYPPGEKPIKYRFWKGQLYEVQVTLGNDFNTADERNLVRLMQEKYGDGTYKKELGSRSAYQRGEQLLLETWTWQDPFTVQQLRHVSEDDSWTIIRRSMMLYDRRFNELRQANPGERSPRLQDIELE